MDPNRLLIKRIVLTGHPINVHKKTAVIRRMFFSPDDIRWFKPVEVKQLFFRVGVRFVQLFVNAAVVDQVRARRTHYGGAWYKGLHAMHVGRAHQTTRYGLHEFVQAAVSQMAQVFLLRTGDQDGYLHGF